MSLIKNYKVVIAVVLPILILVLFRSFGTNHFKSDAKKWAEPSAMRSNIITIEKTGTLSGEKLFLNLDDGGSGINGITRDELNIPSDSILCKKYLNIIRNHDGPVLLFSTETAVSARIWMILSQMGYKNIYILTNDADNEVFKSKFRPDTLIRPEH
ncbi:MAG: hypothetical protein NT144_10660 [Bacteroidia bacterium]|nr:hypothetical protein [Bacteroidia bacterium]